MLNFQTMSSSQRGAMRKQTGLAFVVVTLFAFALLALPNNDVARAVNVPDAPTLGGRIAIISDNDYALFAGTGSNVTRIIQQNNDVFWDQVAAAASYRMSLEDGETYVYLLGMGGGGAEDIGGTLNGVDITSIASGANGLQRAVSRPSGAEESGFFVMHSFFTGWSDASYGNCGGAVTVCYGQYAVDLDEVRTALTGATWGTPPSVGGGQAGNAFSYPDSSAVMFRIKASALGSGLTIASGTSATVTWEEPASDGGAAIEDYTVTAYRVSDNSSAGRSCTTTNAAARSCTVTGLPGGVRYYFKVTARNSAGNSAVSIATGPVSIVDNTPSTTTTTTPVTTTTAPPALDIVVVAPPSTVVSQVTVPVGQSQTPLINSTSKSTPSSVSPQVTTTTMTTMPQGLDAPAAPSPPSVVVGEAAVKVGDKDEKTTVERADNQLVVSAGPLKAVIGGLNSDGTPMALDDAGNVRLQTGDAIRIKLAGFKPGTEMEAWLFSTPILLGTTKVGGDGSVIGMFTIPSNAPSGAHRVVIVAKTIDGKPATLTVGINVGEWDSGLDVAVWLIVLPIAVAVIGALVLPATRRRRRAQTAAS